MLLLFATILLISLIYMLTSRSNEKRKRKRELERIQKRIAEKEDAPVQQSDSDN